MATARQHYRFAHPRLDFKADVTVERDGRFLATADHGEDSRDVGGSGTRRRRPPGPHRRRWGEPYVTEEAEGLSGDENAARSPVLHRVMRPLRTPPILGP
jgi:hypothetical protein